MHTENYGLMNFVFERPAVYVYLCVYLITMATNKSLELYKSHIHQLEANPSINAQNIFTNRFLMHGLTCSIKAP